MFLEHDFISHSKIFRVIELSVMVRDSIFFRQFNFINPEESSKKIKRIHKNQQIHLIRKLKKLPVYLLDKQFLPIF